MTRLRRWSGEFLPPAAEWPAMLASFACVALIAAMLMRPDLLLKLLGVHA